MGQPKAVSGLKEPWGGGEGERGRAEFFDERKLEVVGGKNKATEKVWSAGQMPIGAGGKRLWGRQAKKTNARRFN